MMPRDDLFLVAMMATPMAAMAHGETHGKHGNPDDLEAYIARMEEPERAQWQKPDEVVATLQLKTGQVACDVGAGPGYFSLRLARAVGDAGRGIAGDVEPRLLGGFRQRIETAPAEEHTAVLSLPGDPLLPARGFDPS